MIGELALEGAGDETDTAEVSDFGELPEVDQVRQLRTPDSGRCSCTPWPCTPDTGCHGGCRPCELRGGPLVSREEWRWVQTGKPEGFIRIHWKSRRQSANGHGVPGVA